MAEKKYTIAEAGPRVEQFLNTVVRLGGFKLNYAVSEGETPHPDFENPDILVRFKGEDVDLLLANKAELLLALEQLTMEALGMGADATAAQLRATVTSPGGTTAAALRELERGGLRAAVDAAVQAAKSRSEQLRITSEQF